MATLLRVPEVAAGATEAVLSEWLVKEHDAFAAGDALVVIETDKASVEIEAESAGIVLQLLVPGGHQVEVGSPMALIGTAEEREADPAGLLAGLGIDISTLAANRPSPRRELPESESSAPASATADQPSSSGTVQHGRLFISPLSRRLLREAGLSTDQVRGSGPNGRIMRRDVERAIAESRTAGKPSPPAVLSSAEAAAPVAPTAQPVAVTHNPQAVAPAETGYTVVPHTRLRKVIASRLTASKQSAPHFYLKRTAHIDALLDLRAQLNAVSPHKISINDLIIRAVGLAHRAVPDANVIWTDEGMRQFTAVDVAVAVAARTGLVTPVLRGVDTATPSAIASQMRSFISQAGEGRLHPRDLEGGSISVTNLGMYGVDEFSAIINPPHASILAVGAARHTPLIADGAVVAATQLTLVLSVDHRAIDGVLAAQWMRVLVAQLEEPLRLVA